MPPPIPMLATSPAARYAGVVIALHWLVFLLMAGAYAMEELRDLFPRGSPERATMRLWHYGLGLAVLAAAFLRLVARAATRTPPIVPPPPEWQEKLAKLAHAALYVLMLGLPLVGWLAVSAEGKAVVLAGVPLPMLTGPNEAWVKPLEKIHEIAGQAGYALIGLHAAVALWHHHVVRDDTLARMWPLVRAPGRDDR